MYSNTKNKKIKIAFVKFAGLSSGGTEKFLQTVAMNLSRELFDVTYFYCDTAPYLGSNYKHSGTDSIRKKIMGDSGIKLVEFNVGAKDVRTRIHKWTNTNFWEKFREEDFDIIQTGRAGHPEYPFTEITRTPIVDSLHLSGGVDNQRNISRVMHICKWNAEKWIRSGGDKSRVVLVSHPIEINNESLKESHSLKEKLGISNCFAYGFHQRVSNEIFSHIPLQAFAEVAGPNDRFIIMGGGDNYKKQAKDLNIMDKVIFLPHSGDMVAIYSFLKTLNVYAHGRKDGEVNSTAMAEALYFGLPIVSHTSEINNGHIESIGEAGLVVSSINEYKNELVKLKNDAKYYEEKSRKAQRRFAEHYELNGQMKNIENIYKSVISNPYPNKFRRLVSSFRLKYYLHTLLRKAGMISS